MQSFGISLIFHLKFLIIFRKNYDVLNVCKLKMLIQERLYHHHFIFVPFFQCKNIFMANYILDGLVHLLCIISHNSEIQIHWVVSWMGTKSGTFSRKIPLFGNWVYQLSRNSEELCHALFQIYLQCISNFLNTTH